MFCQLTFAGLTLEIARLIILLTVYRVDGGSAIAHIVKWMHLGEDRKVLGTTLFGFIGKDTVKRWRLHLWNSDVTEVWASILNQ